MPTIEGSGGAPGAGRWRAIICAGGSRGGDGRIAIRPYASNRTAGVMVYAR